LYTEIFSSGCWVKGFYLEGSVLVLATDLTEPPKAVFLIKDDKTSLDIDPERTSELRILKEVSGAEKRVSEM
jgi:hypothetical protein